MKKLTNLRVALVYDRINKWGGAERVLLALHEMFPHAPLYTSVYDEKNAKWAKVFSEIKTSFLQYFPFAKSNHEFLAPFMPLAFESFDFSKFDIVISVTSEAAKGIKTRPNTFHFCYCLTPTRYLWSHCDEYFKGSSFKDMAKPIISYLRKWDKMAAKRPDSIVAISTEIKNRIKKYYKRDSEIIFPPVSLCEALRAGPPADNPRYFLVVSRLVKYKRVDLAIEVFNKLGYPLVVVGTGREAYILKRKAKSNIRFVGQVTEKELAKYYQNAKALIMPQEEDFGIVSVEAQSFGVPVIAFKKGGVQDTIIDKKTGLFFDHQTTESLMHAIQKFDKMSFSERILKADAKRFTKEVFKRQLQRSLVRAYSSWRRGNTSLAGIKS